MSDEPNLSGAKKSSPPPMFFLLLRASELRQPFLCFSFFFDEYLTPAPLVALSLGSLPLALRALLGRPGHREAARNIFLQLEHKYFFQPCRGTSTPVQLGRGSC